MSRNDKTWADLNQPKVRRLCLQPIGYVNKQSLAVRLIAAAKLYFTTNYSWSISWHQAAR